MGVSAVLCSQRQRCWYACYRVGKASVRDAFFLFPFRHPIFMNRVGVGERVNAAFYLYGTAFDIHARGSGERARGTHFLLCFRRSFFTE